MTLEQRKKAHEDLHKLLLERIKANLADPACSDRWATQAISYLTKFELESLPNLPELEGEAGLNNLPFKVG